MGTRFRFLAGIVVPVLLVSLSACNNSSSSSSAGTGAVFVANQGDSTVTSFSIDLSTGLLTANGGSIAAGKVPSAMILAPSGKALFIANSNPNVPPPQSPPCTSPSPGTISAYTVNTDGTLTAASGSTQAGIMPVAMAIDGGGHFLFVANQGLQCIPAGGTTTGTISVFSIQDKALTEVPGSPFPSAPNAPSGTGPSGLAVTPDGKFLYVANEFDSTLTKFSVDASGVLTQGPVASVGTTPAAATITADGGFLYVANASTISGFAICGQVLTSCSDPTSPDGSLTAIEGSPFPSGINPVAMVAAPSGKFLFAVNRQSNQISQYKLATGTGVLTANTQAVISTGSTPVGAAIRAGTTTDTTTGGTTEYLYVPNLGSSSISVYSFDSTVGLLGLVGGPVAITGGQPGAVAAE
jgi:6-phosphogluconolactonase (cycloisomerase 2 family)